MYHTSYLYILLSLFVVHKCWSKLRLTSHSTQGQAKYTIMVVRLRANWRSYWWEAEWLFCMAFNLCIS